MEQGFMDPQDQNVLASIYKDMEVYDRDGNHVGKVDFVYMGSAHGRGEGAATGHQPDLMDTSVVNNLAEAVDPGDNVPDELKNRLFYEGFVRVNSNTLFGRDRYILPSQIDAVSGDRVVLNVTKDDLPK
jgi:hypothetical protein